MTALAANMQVPQAGLDAGIDALSIALSSRQRDSIRAYLALLDKWNRSFNLTAIREPARMVTHHALDALAVLPHLVAQSTPRAPDPHVTRVLDVGTGGGIPGILLAIARPDWRVTLLDANHKKGAFLTQAVIELDLANADVAVSRVEDYRPQALFDIVISRAYADLATFVAGAARHVALDGRLYAMKGVVPDAEIAALPVSVRVSSTITLEVPGLDAARSLVVMQPQ
ncbi:MAG: 16S rRNA (guanine(527)-N(7))-methyltransferase RsmG [Betaproteobacteria bacterium]